MERTFAKNVLEDRGALGMAEAHRFSKEGGGCNSRDKENEVQHEGAVWSKGKGLGPGGKSGTVVLMWMTSSSRGHRT